jgi:hypothetical protein
MYMINEAYVIIKILYGVINDEPPKGESVTRPFCSIFYQSFTLCDNVSIF